MNIMICKTFPNVILKMTHYNLMCLAGELNELPEPITQH